MIETNFHGISRKPFDYLLKLKVMFSIPSTNYAWTQNRDKKYAWNDNLT